MQKKSFDMDYEYREIRTEGVVTWKGFVSDGSVQS